MSYLHRRTMALSPIRVYVHVHDSRSRYFCARVASVSGKYVQHIAMYRASRDGIIVGAARAGETSDAIQLFHRLGEPLIFQAYQWPGRAARFKLPVIAFRRLIRRDINNGAHFKLSRG